MKFKEKKLNFNYWNSLKNFIILGKGPKIFGQKSPFQKLEIKKIRKQISLNSLMIEQIVQLLNARTYFNFPITYCAVEMDLHSILRILSSV